MPTGHEIYIRRCFDLAARGLGAVSPNPLVGCVIVAQDKVIGEGWHERYGGAHAEVNALAAVKDIDRHLLPTATVYVSLEPCCHYGKTPPCTELLIKNKVKQVVISVLDPNPLVAGKGAEALRAAGIDVVTGILESEGKRLIRAFIKNMATQMPYVILKWARSKDGFIGKIDQRTAISNPLSNRLVHQLRSEVDGILVGTTTAIIDNPQLNNRLFYGKSPRPILVDQKLRTPPNLNLRNEANTIIITQTIDYPLLQQQQAIQLPFSESTLPEVLRALYQVGIGILLVEGGAATLQVFLDAGLYDEVIVIESDQNISQGVPQPRFCGAPKVVVKIDTDTWNYH